MSYTGFVCQIKNLKQAKLDTVISVISKLNPLEILKNGYSVLEKNNERISSLDNLSVGDNVKITINDGKVYAIISEIDKKE